MATHESPFDDPEVKAMMEAAGIVHKPGMAAELMNDLAPLLAEQGIDLNNPDADVDLDQLNEAMAYATERYNMELMTPIGKAREVTLAFLRKISITVYDGRVDDALRMITTLSPYESDTAPSVGHVNGVSLDLLDRWLSHDSSEPVFQNISVPRWPVEVRRAAHEVLRAAQMRRAFADSDALTRRYGGLVACQAPAMLVGHLLAAKARVERVRHSEILDTYLSDRALPWEGRGSAPGAGSAFGVGQSSFGHGAGAAFGSGQASTPGPRGGGPRRRTSLGSEHFIQQFEQWCLRDEIADAEADARMSFFRSISTTAQEAGFDVHNPDDYLGLLDWVDTLPEEHLVDHAYAILELYVEFRKELAGGASQWDEVGSELGLMDEPFPDPAFAADHLFEEAESVDEEMRKEAILALPPVIAIPDLLALIGRSRPLTTSGYPRRSDIEPLAAMLGFRAVGVAKNSRVETVDGEEIVYARSAGDIPELAAWWIALQHSDVISASISRVVQGASRLTKPASAHITDLELFVSVMIVEIVTADLDVDGEASPYDELLLQMTLQHLAAALGMIELDEREAAPFNMRWTESRHSTALQRMGVITVVDDVVTVPEPLRFVMLNAFGAIIAGMSVFRR